LALTNAGDESSEQTADVIASATLHFSERLKWAALLES
jgi:hypothetical protein